MTRKDFQVIATAFVMTHTTAYAGTQGYNLAVQYMADELERNYSNFDRPKFVKACGIN